MNDLLISVIVPIYNVEYYLDKCINSIVRQSYKNLEIVLVVDGSPDQCLEKCMIWGQKDDRIKVINKPNGGVSEARNVALDICRGDYIAFADPDDYLSYDMYEKIVSEIKKTDADIILCGYFLSYNDGSLKKTEVFNDKSQLYNKQQALSMLCSNVLGSHLWDKVFKKNLFENLRFPVGMVYEDAFVMHKIFLKANKIIHINEALYYYFQRSESITFGVNKKNINDLFNSYIQRYLDLLDIVSVNDCIAQLKVITSFYIHFCQFQDLKQELRYVREFLLRENKKFRFLKHLPLKKKIQWKLDYLGISYCLQYKLFKKNK